MVDGINNNISTWPTARGQASISKNKVNGTTTGDDTARKALEALFGRTNIASVAKPLEEGQAANEFAPNLGRHLDVIA